MGRLARGLHSSVLDELGLKDALQRFVRDYVTAHHVRVNLQFGHTPFPDSISLFKSVSTASSKKH